MIHYAAWQIGNVKGCEMESIGLPHYGAVAAGLALDGACVFTLIKFNPTPKFNVVYGIIALGCFAFGTGSKLEVDFDTEGLEIRVSELQQQLEAINASNKSYRESVLALAAAQDNWRAEVNELVTIVEYTRAETEARLGKLVSAAEVIDRGLLEAADTSRVVVWNADALSNLANEWSSPFDLEIDTDPIDLDDALQRVRERTIGPSP